MSQPEGNKKPSIAEIAVLAVVGAIVMYVGYWIDSNHALASVEGPLNKMGIPLELGKTVGTIGMFIALFKVIHGFFLVPLFDAINGRTNELESTFGEAENLRAEMTQLKSDYEKRIAETEASAREQIQAQIREAQDLKKELMADAARKADEYKNQAMAEIDAEKRKALTDLRLHVTNLSLQATEKLLGENVDSDRNRKIIDDFLATVEVKN
ncbi:MAG: F0F1 ATP synthase subunit B [Armatimonadetes bacterium]|nr:F0F1 ATP synthase subunit B [Armatimonadota bacterium]